MTLDVSKRLTKICYFVLIFVWNCYFIFLLQTGATLDKKYWDNRILESYLQWNQSGRENFDTKTFGQKNKDPLSTLGCVTSSLTLTTAIGMQRKCSLCTTKTCPNTSICVKITFERLHNKIINSVAFTPL